MPRLADARHLIGRFFGFLRARPLTPAEQGEVAAHLGPSLAPLFFTQRPEDQRHALEVARLADPALVDHDLVEAALLHDIGKAGLGLGAIARSAATIWARLRLPVSGSWQAYVQHGSRGADILVSSGASPLAVAFARHHPGAVPDGIDPDRWEALASADG